VNGWVNSLIMLMVTPLPATRKYPGAASKLPPFAVQRLITFSLGSKRRGTGRACVKGSETHNWQYQVNALKGLFAANLWLSRQWSCLTAACCTPASVTMRWSRKTPSPANNRMLNSQPCGDGHRPHFHPLNFLNSSIQEGINIPS
jgi:hypothetical protein